jgi:hypothetical protein
MNRANSFILRIHQLHCRTPVDERLGRVHRGVTAEKVQEFFRRVHDDTARELNNPVNYQGWDGTNCVSKLLLNFFISVYFAFLIICNGFSLTLHKEESNVLFSQRSMEITP